MATMKRMTDMTRSDEEKSAARMEGMFPPSIEHTPDVPPGLCIHLTHDDLAKLDLEDDCEIGDLLHCTIMAKVTSISKNSDGGGNKCRIEMSIIAMAVEDESTEDPAEEEDAD